MATLQALPTSTLGVAITDKTWFMFCPRFEKDGALYTPSDEELGALLIRSMREAGRTVMYPSMRAAKPGCRTSAIRVSVNGEELFAIDFPQQGAR